MQAAIRKEMLQSNNIAHNSAIIHLNITEREIEDIINNMNLKKAPGVDCISADMIQFPHDAEPDGFTILINKIFKFCYFPKAWKRATLIPLMKPGKTDRTNTKNYRPIWLIPVLRKLLEGVLANRIEHQVEMITGLDKLQHGFRKGISTIDTIEKVVDRIGKAKELGKYAAIISLDIEGALNNACWPGIIQELKRHGCDNNTIRLINNYFKDKTMKVVFPGGVKVLKTEKGCPQGSRIGPLFWNIIYNTIRKI